MAKKNPFAPYRLRKPNEGWCLAVHGPDQKNPPQKYVIQTKHQTYPLYVAQAGVKGDAPACVSDWHLAKQFDEAYEAAAYAQDKCDLSITACTIAPVNLIK